MEYIQVTNNFVTLIGGADVGLPLPEEYLRENPNVLSLRAWDYAARPGIGDYYNAEHNEFIPYGDWLSMNPPAPPENENATFGLLLAQMSTYLERMSTLVADIQAAAAVLRDSV